MTRAYRKYFALLMMFGLIGCSSMLDWSNEISVRENQPADAGGTKATNTASIRVAGYTDGRKADQARKIGICNGKVGGLIGTNIRLDRDATEVVANSISRKLVDAGYPVLAPDDRGAMFELSGVIRELSYDVKERDYVSITLETTLKEVASGQIVWTGAVEQKSDRFAGVSGNDKSDIASHLHDELGIVTGKTVEAINSLLMAKHPELFNLIPGTKVIPGVTVFVAPDSVPPTATPLAKKLKNTEPDTSMLSPINGASGQLLVRSEPGRAKVYLDGVYYGMSPLQIEIAAGIRTVEVRLKGYKKASEKVAIRVGATTELEFQLEK